MPMDIQQFLGKLIATAPKAPHSVELEVDADGDPVALFEVFLTLFIGILKKNYKPPIDLSRISEAHIEECAAYFASFGVQLNITIEDAPLVVHINNKEYETQSRIQDMRFRMTGGSKLYTLQFDFF